MGADPHQAWSGAGLFSQTTVKGLTREIKRYIYHSLTDAQLTRLGSVELNLN